MRKIIYISFIFLFTLSTAWGQRGKKKEKEQEVVETVHHQPSSMDYPYIEKFHQAVREKISGNYNEAQKLFLECIQMKDDDDAVYFALAEIAEQQNKSSEAIKNYKKAYAIDNKNIIYLQGLAYAHYEKADFEEAEPLFKQMVSRESRNVDYRYAYIRVLIYNKSYSEAIEQINKLQEQVGLIPELSNMKADLFLEQKNIKKAEETMLALKKEYPDDLEVLRSLIGFYEQQGDKDKAITLIEELVENEPNNGMALFVLAGNYVEKNDAEKFLSIAPKLFKSTEITAEEKVKIYELLGRIETVEIDFIYQTALDLHKEYPDNLNVSVKYGESLMAQGKSKEALSIFRKAVKQNPDQVEAWIDLLDFESRHFDFQELYEDGQEVISLFPFLPMGYLSAAEGALQLGYVDEASDFLSAGEIYLLDDNRVKSYFHTMKGRILFHQKDFKKGIVEFEKAMSLNQNGFIQSQYALSLAQANIIQDVALETLEKVSEDTKDAKYYRAKAMVLRNQGKLKEGIQVLEKGVGTLHFTAAELFDLLGDFYLEANVLEKAIEAWQNAQELESRNKVLNKKILDKKYYAPNYN